MDFKIDTKTNYTHITPVYSHLNANLAEALKAECLNLAENGVKNFIIDLVSCTDADMASFTALVSLHEDCYENGHSLVFINIQDRVMQQAKQAQAHLTLNIAPTLIEAVDIISMEVLERDLLNEE
ncbi:STAS domain-containing protein [Chitinophagaceae bacterium MMS25-I14]